LKETTLTFEDGILFCKHVFQCAIHKTLQGTPEEWDIYIKTHGLLQHLEKNIDSNRLNDVLFKLNLDDIYPQI
jgi:hypothetical protein